MRDGVELTERIRTAVPTLAASQVDELARVVVRLVSKLAPVRIYVFGSQPRGEATADSDIDLLLVVPRSEEPSYRLAQAAYRAAVPYTCSLDILVMSNEEFDRRRRAVSSLPAMIMREGRVLYAA
ncbi:MAG: nucleotidyltransferase domain-containing protein [Thermomicrobiales bacterium]